jgi:hypothetical protein
VQGEMGQRWDAQCSVGMPVIEALEAPLLRLGLFLRNGLWCDVCLWPWPWRTTR